jgi:hypothetical protein
MITVLGGLAEFERHLILSLTNEGRIRAQAREVKFGRRPELTKHQQAEVLARIAQGLTAIARSYNVSSVAGAKNRVLLSLGVLWDDVTSSPDPFVVGAFSCGRQRAELAG